MAGFPSEDWCVGGGGGAVNVRGDVEKCVSCEMVENVGREI